MISYVRKDNCILKKLNDSRTVDIEHVNIKPSADYKDIVYAMKHFNMI